MAKNAAPRQESNEVAEHPAAANEAETLKYWTEQNQEAAQPVSLPVVPGTASKPPQAPCQPSDNNSVVKEND